jgi:transposase-like protein
MVDARYEQVRVDNLVRDCAVLIALGIDDKGKREVLGVQVSLSEAEVYPNGRSRQAFKALSNFLAALDTTICEETLVPHIDSMILLTLRVLTPLTYMG